MSDLAELVARALAEDVGSGDVTAEAVVPAAARARARIVQKQPGVVFGMEAAAEAFAQCGAEDFDRLTIEGEWRDSVPADVALVSGRHLTWYGPSLLEAPTVLRAQLAPES